MSKERNQLIIRLVTTHLVFLPLLLFVSLFVKSDKYLLLTISQSILIILYFTGYWEFLGLRFRMTYSVAVQILILFEFRWKILSGINEAGSIVFILLLSAVQLLLIIALIRILIVIFLKDRNRYEISFPFRSGKYLITDGGNSKTSRLMNYHFYSAIHKKNKTNYSMLYATDIVRIDKAEKRFFPPKNEDYPIFSEEVLSPLNGVVFRIINNIEDNVPYSGGYPYNTGNTVIIRSGNLFVLLGHLKMESIRVKPGDMVSASDVIAEAGNSGYSERPHIHIQFIESDSENFWKGTGVSIQFKGRNIYKNRVVELN
jgi:hypothetical protein